jgi:microsomal dipeptidase-like Zn-dependent dipeptidase
MRAACRLFQLSITPRASRSELQMILPAFRGGKEIGSVPNAPTRSMSEDMSKPRKEGSIVLRNVRRMALLGVVLGGCMTSPYDGRRVARRTDAVSFGGYHLYSSSEVRVHALEHATGAWVQVARDVSDDAPFYTAPDGSLYPWSTSAILPAQFWELGSLGRGALARVRAEGDTPGGTRGFMSVERDWLECFAADDPPTIGGFAARCASDKTPEAEIATTDFVPEVFGVADLHAHPASHLAFNAGGVFWGNPGLSLVTSRPETDLVACAPDKHAGFDEDHVRHAQRVGVMQGLDAITGHAHTSSGPPSFTTWPHALSVMHQQMHVRWIHRAYQGGLRLMFASTTDNQTLTMLWNRGYNFAGDPVPAVDPAFDLRSARRQIAFIRSLAAQNSSWMEVVSTAADARRAIREGKLALVLSVELDSLTLAQATSLRDEGVRHIVPVHLANNTFGGAAVYGELPVDPLNPPLNVFNTANRFLTGAFFQVVTDPMLRYRLGRPKALHHHRFDFIKGGAVEPVDVSDAEYAALGYRDMPNHGHRNALGANSGAMEALMRLGLMVDLAHMSQASVADTLAVAERLAYPLLDSHTGLRSSTLVSDSERALLETHAARLAALGGVLGLGTVGDASADPLLRWADEYSNARRILGGRGVALGTDFNGLERQMATLGRSVTYPLTAASRRAPRWALGTTPPLARATLGPRSFESRADGLAQYGMLPELFEALEAVPANARTGRLAGTEIVNALFRTAEEVIQFWERAETAAARLGG